MTHSKQAPSVWPVSLFTQKDGKKFKSISDAKVQCFISQVYLKDTKNMDEKVASKVGIINNYVALEVYFKYSFL